MAGTSNRLLSKKGIWVVECMGNKKPSQISKSDHVRTNPNGFAFLRTLCTLVWTGNQSLFLGVTRLLLDREGC